MLFALRGMKNCKIVKIRSSFRIWIWLQEARISEKKKRLSGRKIKRLFPFAVYRWPATSPRKCLEKQAPSQNGMVLLRADVANRGASSGFKGGNETWHPLKKLCKRNSRFTVHGQFRDGGGQNSRKAERRMSKIRNGCAQKMYRKCHFCALKWQKHVRICKKNKKHCKRIKWIRKGE